MLTRYPWVASSEARGVKPAEAGTVLIPVNVVVTVRVVNDVTGRVVVVVSVSVEVVVAVVSSVICESSQLSH